MAEAAKRLDSPIPISDRRLMRSLAYVGGRWRAGGDAAFHPGHRPRDRYAHGRGRQDRPPGAVAAVDAAQDAFPAWAALLPQQRSAILRRWFELIVEAARISPSS
jgi:aspartate-semialdehyde dehydrogenase